MPGGSGAELYLRSAPVPFTAAPMLHAGGVWRLADRSKRHWDSEPRVELLVDGVWTPVAAAAVDRLAGTCQIAGTAEGARVRATGTFLPLAHVGAAEAWKLDMRFLDGSSLDGGSAAVTGARVRLFNVELDPDYLDMVGGDVVAVLSLGPNGRYEAVGQLQGQIPIAADELALAIEPGAITFTAV